MQGVQQSIQDGADINCTVKDITPLMFSVIEGDIKITKKLLELGANPSIKNSIGWTFLTWAAVKGCYYKIKSALGD